MNKNSIFSWASHMERRLRRWGKLWGSALLLCPLYYLCCLRPVEENLAVLADGHRSRMPYSMTALSLELKRHPEIKVAEYFHDYTGCGVIKGLFVMMGFMPLYARAKYVFISDSFVPVSCCKKRKETKVIQLWHSCGLMKKVGTDSNVERISMTPWQYRNFDVFTTSAPCVSEVLSRAMGVPRQAFTDTGVSRMDLLFDGGWKAQVREDFYRSNPQYRDKKIVLWAPTFRGPARKGYVVGEGEILRLQRELPENYMLIIKTHRLARSKILDTPVHCGAEELLAVADILITDYSSIYYDYLYFRRPVVLFAPDLQAYQSQVGLYLPYDSIPGRAAQSYEQLFDAVVTADSWTDGEYLKRLDALWGEQMAYCDGHSTERLLKKIGLLSRDGDWHRSMI